MSQRVRHDWVTELNWTYFIKHFWLDYCGKIKSTFQYSASLVVQLVNNLQCGRPGFKLWVGTIPWRREQLPIPVFWPAEFQGLCNNGVTKSWTWLSDFHFPISIFSRTFNEVLHFNFWMLDNSDLIFLMFTLFSLWFPYKHLISVTLVHLPSKPYVPFFF